MKPASFGEAGPKKGLFLVKPASLFPVQVEPYIRPLLNGAQKQKQKSFFVFVFGNRDIYGPKTKIQVDPIFAGPQKSKISTKTSSVFGEIFSTKTKTKTVLTFSS